ncbi:MAG: hypothetical protein QF749_04150 [Verrucomicrobiota bacterium]|jgi:hypothetical protein|nr:hypothetical protein [Verrucomicrobiota bacterium]MDP7177465.1 hypothetical protein [Verrucomicrobiota bacterium]|tara:strand:- start:609 stop:1001 length:393 start_codon:yes stop_codon:yes gene_type:complete
MISFHMKLLQRQVDDIELTITSVNLSSDSLEITASGPAGIYGNAFCSYALESFDEDSGFSYGCGRGFPDEGSMVTGNFAGLWRRDGNKIEIKQVVDIDNGTQNLDVITIDMHAKTVLIRPYILDTVTLSA